MTYARLTANMGHGIDASVVACTLHKEFIEIVLRALPSAWIQRPTYIERGFNASLLLCTMLNELLFGLSA